MFDVHLLDMGARKYGDCLLCRIGRKVILIDGGHLGDHVRRDPDVPSISEQLEKILGSPSPWHIDLLVVTHTHADHIGCLPHLVAAGRLQIDWALVADEDLGWGDVAGLDGPRLAEAPDLVQQAFALWREETPSFADRAELEAFASDAARLRTNYSGMLSSLAHSGTRVVRYGKDDPSALLKSFRSIGLKILGPTPQHLLSCSHQIASLGRDAIDTLSSRLEQDASLDLVALSLQLKGKNRGVASDREEFSIGAAVNNQSLVLSLERFGRKVLLTGDMQFAEPGGPGLEDSVNRLRQSIAAEAPFDVVKLAHHGARNAVDPGVLAETQATLIVISGGGGSSRHPHPETLDTLKAARSKIVWYRTDRNGLIRIDLAPKNLEVAWARGEANDISRNHDTRDFLEEAKAAEVPQAAEIEARSAITLASEVVEVVARLPHRKTRVVITIEVEPPEGAVSALRTGLEGTAVRISSAPVVQPARVQGALRLAGGRDLPPLLFATDPDALADNIGKEEARAVCKMLEDSGHQVVFDGFRKMDCSRAGVQVRSAVGGSKIEGIVLVGGYDIISPDSVDVLSAEHRRAIDPRYDPDRFLVWSDDFYGDLDGDDIPEIPVSRVPDGRSARLLQAALTPPWAGPVQRRAGLRNLARPFAQEVYTALPGESPLLVSHPATPSLIDQGYFSSDAIYIMLHGRASNARVFLGETEAEEMIEAFDQRNLHACPGAVVFTGCCWGALIVEETAWTHNPGTGFAPRSPEGSLALGFLAAGANAFIGCTGAHYSPKISPYNYASGPLHREFWRHLVGSALRPAAALLQAKRSYLKGIPYPNPVPGEDPGPAAAAVEKKLLAQFTCLGLGW